MESESHFTSQDAFLPPSPNCPGTPGFSSSKGVISVSKHQRDGEYGGPDQAAVACPTSFSAAGASVTTTLHYW